MEQGKDIISVDKKGIPCAFQLKSGDIDLTEFRKIKGEIDELVELHINFPGVRKDIYHRAVLVTNGKITDPVRRDIDDLNTRYATRGFSQLEVKTKLDLLKDFLDVNRAFMPTDLLDFKHFLELLLYDGHKFVDKELLASFIGKLLFIEQRETNLKTKRRIANSVLLTEYALSPFEATANHISIVEGWTLCCSYILGLVEKLSLEPEYWKQSYDLAIHKINLQLELLKEEFFSRSEYFESAWDGGAIYKSRFVIVLGWLSAYELFLKKADPAYVIDKRVYERIRDIYNNAQLWFWGESATPFFMLMSLLARECSDEPLSDRLISNLIALIATENSPENNDESSTFADPYYSSEEVLSKLYNVGDFNSESFVSTSYHIGALVAMLVRRGKRKLLEAYWKDICLIRKCEFYPSPKWKTFTWHSEEGEQIELYYERPQSWNKLVKEVTDYDISSLPVMLQSNAFAYYFVLCYPHRLGQKIACLIDENHSPRCDGE
jgi:hypothetical protein